MGQKKKTRILLAVLLPVILLLALAVSRPGYYLYREMTYRLGTPTQSERTVMAYAKDRGIPYGAYPRELIALLDTSPEAEAFVLGYPDREDWDGRLDDGGRDTVPLFLQWDPRWGYDRYGSSYLAVTGCGPTCLAMAGYYLTGDAAMNPRDVAAFAEKNGYYAPGYGSSWTLISEGAAQLGLEARELPLVKKKMVDALNGGSPVILALGKGDFTTTGHYVVLTAAGEDGFRLNDPNSQVRSERVWTYEELEHQIRNIWAIGLPSYAVSQ